MSNTCPLHRKPKRTKSSVTFTIRNKEGKAQKKAESRETAITEFLFCGETCTRDMTCLTGYSSLVLDLVCGTTGFLIIQGRWLLHPFKCALCPVCMTDFCSGLRSHTQAKEEDNFMVWCVAHSLCQSAFGEMPCSCLWALHLSLLSSHSLINCSL